MLSTLLLFLIGCSFINISPAGPTTNVIRFKMRMPDIVTNNHDEYMVSPFPLAYDDAYIIGYDPVDASSDKVHHLLLYGCKEPSRTDVPYWNIGDMGGICKGESFILWAWALDAPKLDLPKNVGFHVGKNAGIKYLMLQIHYKNIMTTPDTSGIDVMLTKTAPLNLAGIYLFATGGTKIVPKKVTFGDTTCLYNGADEMIPFAFRTHTHLLGRQVSAWRERDGNWTLLGTRNPRLPQMFYLMKGEPNPIRKGDILHARCVFDGRNISKNVYIGGTNKDEMCNFYMMYHMPFDNFKLYDGCYRELHFKVPDYAKVEFSLNYMTASNHEDDKTTNQDEDRAKLANQTQVDNTTDALFALSHNWTFPATGQVGGLSHTPDNKYLVVFHRGGNDWSSKVWFGDDGEVLFKDDVVPEDTILFLDPQSGKITKSFGGNMFILPHGVYVDADSNVWVTDVALHQVLRFPANSTEPDLVLGEKFVPGDDEKHFCKPTSVVVDEEKNIYVGDGYCNSRVVKFDKSGQFIAQFGKFSIEKNQLGGLSLVHDLSIDNKAGEIYIADRENGQIHVMDLDGNFTRLLSCSNYKNIYALEYSELLGSVVAVNISSDGRPGKVMLINTETGNVTKAYPQDVSFTMPHAIAFIPDTGIFVGEVSEPFKVWKLSQTTDIKPYHHRLFFNTLVSNIPISFIIVVICLAGIPIAYLGVVVVFRCTHKGDTNYDKTGFQKLLRDYDSSDDSEDDLVFKNSRLEKSSKKRYS